jgi:hypothetical protein
MLDMASIPVSQEYCVDEDLAETINKIGYPLFQNHLMETMVKELQSMLLIRMLFLVWLPAMAQASLKIHYWF